MFDGNRTARGAFLAIHILVGNSLHRVQLCPCVKACVLPLTYDSL